MQNGDSLTVRNVPTVVTSAAPAANTSAANHLVRLAVAAVFAWLGCTCMHMTAAASRSSDKHKRADITPWLLNNTPGQATTPQSSLQSIMSVETANTLLPLMPVSSSYISTPYAPGTNAWGLCQWIAAPRGCEPSLSKSLQVMLNVRPAGG